MDVKSEKIRELRLSNGWSQEQLAEIAGTTMRTIQRLESGSVAALETIKAVANAFELGFQELLNQKPTDPVLDAEREQREREFAQHRRLRDLEAETVRRLVDYWNEKTPGFVITAAGDPTIEKWVANFSIQEVMEAMDVSARQYLEFGQDGRCLREAVERAFEKIPAICFVNRRSREQPEIRDL
jgi:transcriptional regulator with XRE-family HTH domain